MPPRPPGGSEAATSAAAVQGDAAELALHVPQPRAWTPESPTLYTLRLELRDDNGATLDVLEQRIGIRTARVTERGFELNGRGAQLSAAVSMHTTSAAVRGLTRTPVRRKVSILKISAATRSARPQNAAPGLSSSRRAGHDGHGQSRSMSGTPATCSKTTPSLP